MADHIVFVFNIMQPPSAIQPCNQEASEDKLRLSKLPKMCQSLLGSSCSVGGHVGGSTFVSSCCLVVRVYSVVAVSPSLVSSFTVIGGGSVNLNESIRHLVLFSDFPATADLPANDIFLLFDGLSTGLHCFIVTTWFDSNEAPGLLSKCPHLNHMRDTFLPKTKCACDVAQSCLVQLRQLFTNITINNKNVAMLNSLSLSLSSSFPLFQG